MIEEAYNQLVTARAEKDDAADPIEEVGQAVSITGAVVPIEAVAPVGLPAVLPIGEGGTTYTWGDKSVTFTGPHTAADVEAAFRVQG